MFLHCLRLIFVFHPFLLSVAFSPFPLLFLLLSTLIYLNLPPGENRSLPQSGTNCFVRFMSPEPNPDKRSLVRPLCYLFLPKLQIELLSKYALCLRVAFVETEKARSLTAHQSCHIRDKGPNRDWCWGLLRNKPELLLIRKPLLKVLSVLIEPCKFGLILSHIFADFSVRMSGVQRVS